jgi:hypothetical protein
MSEYIVVRILKRKNMQIKKLKFVLVIKYKKDLD